MPSVGHEGRQEPHHGGPDHRVGGRQFDRLPRVEHGESQGLGRENGAEAIEGYLQSKSVWINNGPGGGNPFVMKTAG